MAERTDQQPHVRRTAEGPAGGRHPGRCGRCYRVPAQYLDTLRFHLVDGRLRLYGTRCVHHGQNHAQDGTARQVVHPDDYGIRV